MLTSPSTARLPSLSAPSHLRVLPRLLLRLRNVLRYTPRRHTVERPLRTLPLWHLPALRLLARPRPQQGLSREKPSSVTSSS